MSELLPVPAAKPETSQDYIRRVTARVARVLGDDAVKGWLRQVEAPFAPHWYWPMRMSAEDRRTSCATLMMLTLDDIEADRLLPAIAAYAAVPYEHNLASHFGVPIEDFRHIACTLVSRGSLRRYVTPDGRVLYYPRDRAGGDNP